MTGCFSKESTLDVGYEGSDKGYTAALIAADSWNTECQANLIQVHRGPGAIHLTSREYGSGASQAETTIQRPGLLHTYGPKRATDILVQNRNW